MKLERSIIITGKIHCITGLCIGGSSNALEIGGVSQEVIKNPITKEPYIPGSSLKGKMRSELEKRHGSKKWNKSKMVFESEEKEPCGCGNKDCLICSVFGAHKKQNAKSAPTRIIVRDAMLSEESKEMIKSLPLANRSYVERKVENIIKRDIGTADSPRIMERVPAGMSFDFEIILRIFEGDEEGRLLAFVKEGLEAVESSYLGGSGSRGYGQVRFEYHIEGHKDAENGQLVSREA